jgi:hypothetical protein
MRKLTLSVDPAVVARAKRYARTQGTSVSRLVEKMLDVAASGTRPGAATGEPAPQPPVLARLRGSLKRGTGRDHRRYLERKYR